MTNKERAEKLLDSITPSLTNYGQTYDERVGLILDYADEVRRECAEMAVAVLEASVPTVNGGRTKIPDHTIKAMKPYMRTAIIGKEAGV